MCTIWCPRCFLKCVYRRVAVFSLHYSLVQSNLLCFYVVESNHDDVLYRLLGLLDKIKATYDIK